LTKKHIINLKNILSNANLSDDNLERFKRYGSSRSLYNFKVDNAKI